MWDSIFIIIYKNMKKILPIIALSATLFLSGCWSSGQKLSFQEAYTKLTANKIINIQDTAPINTPLQDQTTIDFSLSSPQWFHASGTLVASGQYDMSSGAANIDITLQGKAFEPSFGAAVNIAGLVKIANDTKATYAFIDNMSIVPETGNVDGWLMTALIGSISKKWINLSSEDTTITTDTGSTDGGLSSYHASITRLVSHLQEGIATYPLLKETGKTKVDGKLAYNVDWNAEGVSGFVNFLLKDSKNFGNNITFSGATLEEVVKGILESPIAGQLIIYSEDNIVLRIDSITTKDAGIISLSYSSKDWLTWTNTDTDKTIIATGDILAAGKEIIFHINVPSNNVSLIGETKDNQKALSVTLTTPDITLLTMIKNTTSTLSAFTPTIVSGAMFIQDLTQGFNLLAGYEEPSTQPTIAE